MFQTPRRDEPAASPPDLNTSSGLSRRDWLAIAGVVGLGALPLPMIYSNRIKEAFLDGLDRLQEDSAANKFLLSFPDESQIPRTASVDKIRHRDAQFCLVHIRQEHPVPKMTSAEREEMRRVQADIAEILKYLRSHPAINLREVYLEGIVREDAKRDGSPGIHLHEPMERAAVRLYRAGELDIKAAETRVGRAMLVGASSPLFARMLVEENREDIVLELIDENRDSTAFAIYGGKHDWCDTIERWNRRNPDKKFSLIEITPLSYPD